MSIIEKSNPLNLQYRVCIVSNASTPLGIIVCKTLLKANAFVLSFGTKAPDPNILNARPGTHFQFEECDATDAGTPQKLIKASSTQFGTNRIDALINLVDVEEEKAINLDNVKKLSEAVAGVMSKEGQGTIVTVVGNGEDVADSTSKPVIDLTQALASQNPKLRCNAIVPGATGGDEQSKQPYEEAKESYMRDIMQTEKYQHALVTDVTSLTVNRIAKDLPANSKPDAGAARLYDIGNVNLFLVGNLGENIAGKVVRPNGVVVSS